MGNSSKHFAAQKQLIEMKSSHKQPKNSQEEQLKTVYGSKIAFLKTRRDLRCDAGKPTCTCTLRAVSIAPGTESAQLLYQRTV